MAINPPVDATQTEAWAKLQRHYDEMQSEGIDLKKWFADDENRVDDLTFDYTTCNPIFLNMDGVHLDGWCHHGKISNLRGMCFDDMVALNAADGRHVAAGRAR